MSLAEDSPDHDAFFEFAAYPTYCLSSQISIGALCPWRTSDHRLWDRGMRASDIGIRPRQRHSLIDRGGLCLLLIQRLLNVNKGSSIDSLIAGKSIVCRRHFVRSTSSPVARVAEDFKRVRSLCAKLLLRLISIPLDSVLFHISLLPHHPIPRGLNMDFWREGKIGFFKLSRAA
jgi:hypothetical protein